MKNTVDVRYTIGMHFKVGNAQYRLRIAPGELSHEGARVTAATLQDDRELLISGTCQPAHRLHVLLRELTRAWAFETGRPDDPEGWYDLAASMATAALTSLNAQGGELALVGLRPGESLQPATGRIGIGTARQCAHCNGTVAGGSVAWRPGVLPGVAELRIYCDFCDQTQVWREAVNAKGLPTNIPIGEPTFERGDTTGITSLQIANA